MPYKYLNFVFVLLLPMASKALNKSNTTEKTKMCSNERVATNKTCDYPFVSESHVHFSLNISPRYT